MNLQELRSKRNQLLVDMQKIAVAGFNTESRTAYDAMDTDLTTVEADIEREERLKKRVDAENHFERSLGRGAIGDGIMPGGSNERRSRLNKAMQRYMQIGVVEDRSLLTTSDVTGGALIPQEFFPILSEALKFYGPVATRVRQRVTDNGRVLKLALSDDTSNGLTLLGTEGSSSPNETDPTFQSKLLGVDTASGGLIKVSVEELSDSEFSLDTLIREQFGLRYARGMEVAVTNGVDSAGTQLPNFPVGGLLGSASVGFTTGTLAAGIGWTDIVSTFASLDPAYAVKAVWQMNSNTRATLLSLKDSFGRPFWTPDPVSDSPFSKLLGSEVILNQALPNAANPTTGAFVAGAKPILFGDLERSFLLRTDGLPSIVKLVERYMDQLLVGFMMYTRIGGASLAYNSKPLVALQLAAS